MGKKKEIYWEDDMDPESLRRRAEDLRKDGFFAASQMLLDRASELERWK